MSNANWSVLRQTLIGWKTVTESFVLLLFFLVRFVFLCAFIDFLFILALLCLAAAAVFLPPLLSRALFRSKPQLPHSESFLLSSFFLSLFSFFLSVPLPSSFLFKTRGSWVSFSHFFSSYFPFSFPFPFPFSFPFSFPFPFPFPFLPFTRLSMLLPLLLYPFRIFSFLGS